MSNETKLAPFNPSTLAEAMDMSKMLASSALIPTPLKGKPGDVLVILMKGRELGLSPLQALSEVYVVEGKPSASAKLKLGLCLQRPDICLYFRCVESSAKRAVYETQRAGSQPVRMEWTIEQAQKAALIGRPTWKSYPETMLRHRCESALADSVYPDLVQGLMITDEAEDIRERQATERALNDAPTTNRTESLKEKLRSKLEAFQSAPELPQATQVEAPRLLGPKEVYDRIIAMGADSVGLDEQATRAELKRLTGKSSAKELTEADLAAFTAWVENVNEPPPQVSKEETAPANP